MEYTECNHNSETNVQNQKKVIRIGNAGGYWGDDPYALRRQVQGALKLDYITIDYLAELTMSILQKQKSRNPELGYARDFISAITPLIEECVEKQITIVTNAGGINPLACKDALLSLAQKKNLTLKVAVVDGDNIHPNLDTFHKNGVSLDNMETGEKAEGYTDKILCANAYIGAQPIVDALKEKPHIVICGRVTDSSLTLGPLMYEFDWQPSDYNKLAHGIVAGHLLECGAQATGGNFTDWQKVESFIDVGFPIVECFEDGTFILTKHPNTGGLVSAQTVREQLLYETFDTKAYLTPDVIADFTTIEIEEVTNDRVKLFNIKGYAPTDKYKISLAYRDGYKCSGTIIISGPDAYEKSRVFADMFWTRLKKELKNAGIENTFSATQTEYIGNDSTHKNLFKTHTQHEILLKLGVRDANKDKLLIFRKFLPSIILSGPCGVAVTGGAPNISEVVSFWPALLSKSLCHPKASVFETE